ncbi:MAG: L-lactate permease [Anaerolineae bacterium]
MNTFLAATPLLLILVLMVGFRWGGSKAGAVGWAAALVIAALFFGVGPQVLLWAQIEGFFRAAYVLYIIWGALLFFRVTEADGTLEAVSDTLQRLAPGHILQVLLLAYGFTSFLQGVGGFGVPVAVVAPILVTMGFSAVNAVVTASLGLAWAVSFGSLGASYEALISATELEGAVVAPWMALTLSLVCVAAGAVVLWVASGGKPPRREIGPVLSMALVMSAVQYGVVRLGVENIAAMLGALAGLIVGGGWALLRRRRVPKAERRAVRWRQVPARMLPYVLLITIIFAVNFIPFLNQALNQWVVQFRVPALALHDGTVIPATQTKSISIFGHPGAQLIYTAIITILIAKLRGNLPQGSAAKIRRGVLRSGTKSTLGILAMMAMATTMQLAGMVSELSRTMAAFAGQLFPLMAPFIGALGAFMTGSNTNSNVLLGAFQLQVAQALKLFVPFIIALHNAGAAVGSVFSPAKIIVGCSTVGLSGQESDALRRTTLYGLIMLSLLAALGLIVIRLELLP